jgi:Na+-driven multidrug efflux pump
VGIGFRVIQSCIMPCVALATSVASLVGQNYGARKPERVKAAIVWGFTYAIGVSLVEYAIIAVAPHFWVSLFAREADIVSIGGLYLLVMGLILPLNAYSMVITFAAQGLGRTIMPMLAVGLRLAVYIVTLQVLQATIGISLPIIFWAGAAISLVDLITMSGVLVKFWRGVLKSPPAAASTPVVAPAPEAG